MFSGIAFTIFIVIAVAVGVILLILGWLRSLRRLRWPSLFWPSVVYLFSWSF
jgi:multisubunit Na+/H+ antiporter MnhB subunit